MKRFKNLSLKKKRALAGIGVSVLCLVVVGTIAYNQDSMYFNNLFRLGDDYEEFVEVFDSPDDWQPCQETPKTAIARNKNSTPRYVRMKINEYWREKNSQTPASDHETSDLPLTWDDSGTTKNYAVINTQNDDKWELKRDGWYYYKTALSQDEETLSLLKSVTFNCEVNTAGEIRYSADGKAGESVPTEYSEATYHLYITFQMSDEPLEPERTRLYDQIASETKGVNSDVTGDPVNYAAYMNKYFDWLDGTYPTTLEEGVFTYADSASAEHPVYYYRGKIRNNHVKFHDICWRIVRTTETGGTKIIYDGLPQNDGSCYEDDNSTTHGITITDSSNGIYYSGRTTDRNILTDSSIASAGYMMDDYYFTDRMVDDTWISTHGASVYKPYSSTNPVVASQSISYSNGVYILTGDKTNIGSADYADGTKDVYRYTCFSSDSNATCTTAGLILATASNRYYYLEMTSGKMREEVLNDVFNNKIDSTLKSVIDSWYAQNLANETDKFEDTVWCNDRSIANGPYEQGNTNARYGDTSITMFNAFFRLLNNQPSLACSREDDRFTVSANNGNGKLTYPVATITSDEMMLAGVTRASRISYLMVGHPLNSDIWTMTPSKTVSSAVNSNLYKAPQMFYSNGAIINSLYEVVGNYERSARPMVSFKYDTYVTSGDGTAADPYILEW